MTTPHHDEMAAAHAALDDLDVPATLEGQRLPLAERLAWLNPTGPTDGERPAAPLRGTESERERVLDAASVWARATNALPLGVEAGDERDALLAAVDAWERPAEARPRFVPPATIAAAADNDAAAREHEQEYRVRWEIDVAAGSRTAAARKAREAQQRPDSDALVFEVIEHDPREAPAWELADVIDLAEMDAPGALLDDGAPDRALGLEA